MTTSNSLTIRRARTDELDTTLELLKRRIEWLRSQGSDQWSGWEQWPAKMLVSLERGHVWLLLDGADPIGTITVEFRGDSDFWTTEECAVPAAYLSKLAVRQDHAGAELGVLLLDWARDHAYRHGCRYVRLDAWKTNSRLHDYYVHRGWSFLRTVDIPGRNSGTLFQLHVAPMALPQRERIRDENPLMSLEPTRVGSGSLSEPDLNQNWHPTHVHRGGLQVQYDAISGHQEGYLIDFMRYRVREISSGEWQLESVNQHFVDWQREGTVLQAPFELSPGTTYVITHQDSQTSDACQMVVAHMPPELATSCLPPLRKVEVDTHRTVHEG